MKLLENKLNVLMVSAAVAALASAGFAASATAAETYICGLTYSWYIGPPPDDLIGQKIIETSACGCGVTTWGILEGYKVTTATPSC